MKPLIYGFQDLFGRTQFFEVVGKPWYTGKAYVFITLRRQDEGIAGRGLPVDKKGLWDCAEPGTRWRSSI